MRNGVEHSDKDALRIVSEAGIWGTIRYHGLLGDTVIVSDDAGQFQVGNHALCWVDAERLLQKLMPAMSRHIRVVEKYVISFGAVTKRRKSSSKAPP